jgi:transcriptional regulator with XRE-family HTH domain
MSEETMNERLKALIKVVSKSPTDFAKSLGVSPGRVNNVTSGRNNFNYEFVKKIVETYRNVNLTWLLIGEGEMFLSDEPGVANHPLPECPKGTYHC